MAVDPHFAARGAPPGSLRWHALLYASSGQRDRLAAAFALEAELREISRGGLDHGAAHGKLDWGGGKSPGLARGEPRHPLTRMLATRAACPATLGAALQQALGATGIELAQAVLQDESELEQYLQGSGAAPLLLASAGTGGDADDAHLAAACGRLLRLTEIIRDLRHDGWRGRVLVPWNWVEEAGLDLEALRAEGADPRRRALLQRLAALARRHWAEAPADGRGRPERRALQVLAALHLALLDRMEKRGFATGTARTGLPPFTRLVVAWRAARRA